LDAETGDELWNFETGERVGSSPTVSDGTVYVGSSDGNVYALKAASGSSDGSRVAHGTLGHHGVRFRANADEGATVNGDGENVDGNRNGDGDVGRDGDDDETDNDTSEGEGLPGMGFPAALASLLTASYVLSRRFDDER